MARKKIIQVEDNNPFGEEVDPRYLGENARDASFLPGYSDKRTQREEQIRKNPSEKAPELDYRLHWVRAQRTDGSTDGAKIAEWRAGGYRMLNWEDAKNLGIKVDESAARKGEDGNVYWGDNVLMVADKEIAASHYWGQRQRTASQPEELVFKPMREAIENYERRTGDSSHGDPIFEIEHTAEKKSKKKKK